MRWMGGSSPRMTARKLIDHSLMTIHLNTQADLEDAIHALVSRTRG